MRQDPASTENRLEQTIAVLFEITSAVSQARSLTELYPLIHQALGAVLPADNFFIVYYDTREDLIRFSYLKDLYNPDPGEIRGVSQTLSCFSQVILSRAPMVFSEQESAGMAQASGCRCRVPKTWIGAPLMIREKVIGVMGIQDYVTENAFDQEDLNLLKSVSQHVALAIERKESETELKEQRRIMENILESSPVGIALVQNRVFKWVNSEMIRMFGYRSKQDFQDQSVQMVYPAEEDFELAGKTIYEGLSSLGKADYEMNLMRSDKSLFPVHIRLNTSGEDDPRSWIIGTFTDISQRRAAEKETVERERLQGVLEMAGAVCHEINQPLQAIIGYAELLEMEPELTRTGNSINAIKSQAIRLGKITSTLANITQYKTLDYPGKAKIVDIWGAGSQKTNSGVG